jgi:hypothetical protein
MAKKSPDKVLSDSQLGIATAEKVFGWKNVNKHNGELIGKKQDKLGRWRKAKVPIYSSDPDERMSSSGTQSHTSRNFPGLRPRRTFPASGPRRSNEVLGSSRPTLRRMRLCRFLLDPAIGNSEQNPFGDSSRTKTRTAKVSDERCVYR